MSQHDHFSLESLISRESFLIDFQFTFRHLRRQNIFYFKFKFLAWFLRLLCARQMKNTSFVETPVWKLLAMIATFQITFARQETSFIILSEINYENI